MTINIGALEKKIGVVFKDKNILIKSLTHKSHDPVENYEKLWKRAIFTSNID